MSSSPIEYTSFMKILLCCNIPALSASSLQKKEEIKLCVKYRTLMKRQIVIHFLYNCVELQAEMVYDQFQHTVDYYILHTIEH
jgi:hypothetical protein